MYLIRMLSAPVKAEISAFPLTSVRMDTEGRLLYITANSIGWRVNLSFTLSTWALRKKLRENNNAMIMSFFKYAKNYSNIYPNVRKFKQDAKR